MMLYSIQWQASYNGNWYRSCHTYKPGSIWIMQIIKNWETTKRGPQVSGLPSWTWSMDYLRGPRTTPLDHSRGPLARHQIFGVWILDSCAWKNVLEPSSVIIIIVETLHKMWSSKSIHYMTVLKYKRTITTLMQSFRIYGLKIGSFFRSLQKCKKSSNRASIFNIFGRGPSGIERSLQLTTSTVQVIE
jgi:hypothetical protein